METNTLIIVIGTLFTLALILSGWVIIGLAQRNKTKVLLEHQRLQISRQKDIAENTLSSQEQERQRLGLELHDDLGPIFTAISVNLKRVTSFVEKGKKDKALSILKDTSEQLTDAVGRFSEVSRVLYPVIFNREGLEVAVLDIINNYGNKTGITFSTQLKTEAIESDLVRLAIYRVVQELTTNAVKHSQASKVSLSIVADSEHINLIYIDNGVGFEINSKFSGLGLNSINGRVEALNGTVSTAINKGLEIKIYIPNEKNSSS
jgi:signal transduction histidine kinase